MKQKTSFYIQLFLATALLSLFFGCEIQENFKYPYAEDNSVLDVSALEFIQENDSLSLMAQAIERAGFEDFYKGKDPFTFIVPNNQAFREYFKDNEYSSIADIPLPILRNILKYHLVQAEVNFNDPDLSPKNNPIPYSTENGQTMFLSHTGTFVGLINEGTNRQWEIKTSNLVPTNGVIHVVRSIVYYSAPTGEAEVENPDLELDTLYAKHDTYVNGGIESNKNFGGEALLKVKNVDGNGDYDRKAFLMFDFKDFKKEGVVTDLRMKLSVSFTHAKGVDMDVFEASDTLWTEYSLNFDNAPFPTSPKIASIKTKKVDDFVFDLTAYYQENEPDGLRAFMLDGEAGSDETDDLASKEHTSLEPPMLIATFAAPGAELTLDVLKNISFGQGDVVVLSSEYLSVGGAAPSDIFYTIEEAPSFGWLIKGSEVLRKDSKFSQLDLNLKNIIFIHDGETPGTEDLVLTARDRAGAILGDIKLTITAN